MVTPEEAIKFLENQGYTKTTNKSTTTVFEIEKNKYLAILKDVKNASLTMSDGVWFNDKSKIPPTVEISEYSSGKNLPLSLQKENKPIRFYPKTLEDIRIILSLYKKNGFASEDSVSEKSILPTKKTMNPPPLNQIIFGPPGTGKTYITVTKALEILDPQFLQDLRTQKLPEQSQRQQMKQRFDALYTQGRVLFTTFHQSFSYEDFVEGIRAVNDEETKQLNYPVVDGVFKTLCNKAATHGKTPSNSSYFPFYVNQNIGTGYTVLRISEDLVELRKPSHPNKVLPLPRSIIEKLIDYALQGKITEDDVRKKLVFERIPDAPLEKFLVNGYENVLAAMVEIAMNGDATEPPVDAPTNNAHVLVIDEINRGNVSRIFGELITLIEPSKRAGATEALTVTLPYSKQPFSVPSNVYIIGTMNTTDRSLAGLDVALRRRFAFEELMPDADLLKDAWVRDAVHSVNIGEMLTVMNERIEALLDREHQLGHAFFMPLMEKDKATLPTLANIFRQSVLPLLQEYFFDDWGRIAWVLNDHRKSQELRFVQEHGTPLDELFGKEAADLNPRKRWRLNSDAFDNLGSFAGIVQVQTDATAV